MGLVNITISTKRHAFCTSYRKTRLSLFSLFSLFCLFSSTAMACTRTARSRSPAQTREQLEQFVRALPAAELLELCCWRVACHGICEDVDCRCLTLSCFKVSRFSTQYTLMGEYCGPRSAADQSQVNAARAEIKRRSLCCCCGGKLVAIGHARINGAWHKDWSSRRYHKKCWLAALRGDFGEYTHETDVE